MELHNLPAAEVLRIASERGKLDKGQAFASSEDGRAIAHRKGATWMPDDQGSLSMFNTTTTGRPTKAALAIRDGLRSEIIAIL